MGDHRLNNGERVGPRAPIAAVPVATPRRLVITVDFPTGDQISVHYSRATNHIEVALIGLQLSIQHVQQIAIAQSKVQSRPDPSKPHSYDVNHESASSVRGGACGVCGNAKDNVEIHPFETAGA